MKHIFILLIVCAKLCAQTSTTTKYLDKNKVKARIDRTNDKFWNISGNGQASYEVPKGQGRHAMFANSIWIGGLDHGGQLHMAANTYKQAGTDFWQGPLDTVNIGTFSSTNTATYNRLWKVDCNDINNFATAFNNGSVAAGTYTIPNDILNYPAKGSANFQKNLSPFKDANSNSVYNPQLEGDYPLIKGHQQILSIYNDNYGVHGETGAAKMGIEIHERAYSYSEPSIHDSMQAINYTTFYHYTIYNRSSTHYHNVYIGDWSDVDLGYYLDDYIGSDSLNNFAYCYNAGTNDPSGMGVNGYGNKPPVSSHAILPTNCSSDGIDNDHDGTIDEVGEQFLMDRVTYYNNNYGSFLPQTTNPSIAIHYYNYLSGFWKDGSPFTYGGDGYGGTTASPRVYPGDPQNNTGWTESSAGNTAGDRRILLSSGPFNFPANSKIEWSYAIVFSQDTSGTANTISQFSNRVQRDVRNIKYYETLHQDPQCAPTVSFVSTVGIEQNENVSLTALIYPNPAKDKLTIDLTEQVKTARVRLIDIAGRTVQEGEIREGYRTQLELSGLENGIYFVEVRVDEKILREKIIKN